MAGIRTLIVDDEPSARRGLRLLLRRDPDVEIIGECRNGLEAVRAIGEQDPDLVLLDVQMPGLSGFDVLRQLDSEHIPVVIFVTAYDQYALQAFEAHALDYLLKPFTDRRFRTAMARAKATLQERNLTSFAQRVLTLVHQQAPLPGAQSRNRTPCGGGRVSRIVVKSRDKVEFVDVPEIDWITARGDYLVVCAGGRRHLVRATMKEMEERLDPARFVRIHRSAIVNLGRVRELQPYFHGDYVVVMHDGAKLRLARRRREDLERLLGQRL
ncbi:MAG: LytR/AlgR family response regulator transcription factor [Gemmatimonadales bacterium]